MKKIILSLLILIVTLIIPAFAQQKQRLGIKPQEIILDGAQDSFVKIEAYCFDRHVFVDNREEYNYKFLQTDQSTIRVFVNGKEYSLSKAIDAGKIKVTGRSGRRDDSSNLLAGEFNLLLEITKLVSEKVVVKVEKVSVFRNTPGTYTNQNALDALASSNSSQDRETVQDAIWLADINRSRLETLNYNTVEEFQRQFNLLPVTGKFDAQTTAKLEAVEKILIAHFEENYLAYNRDDTKVKSLADNISSLERIYGVEVTGRLTPRVKDLLVRYKTEHLPKIEELRTSQRVSNAYVFRLEPSYEGKNLYTLYFYRGVYKIKDTKSLTRILSSWAATGQDVYVYLEGFSPEKAEGLKTTIDIQAINMLKTETTNGKFFLMGAVTQTVSISPITKIGSEFRATLVYKTVKVTTNQKMTITAKLKNTVSKFVDSFKKLVNGKRTLANIVSLAREKSEPVRLGFGELGEIEIIELFREKSFEINIE